MICGYSADAVRAAEAPLLAAGEPLMLRAAAALAEHVREELGDGPAADDGIAPRVLVLAGSGANGGDGLHAAAMLREVGIPADAIATSPRIHEGGARALREAGGTIHRLHADPGDAASAGSDAEASSAVGRLLGSAEVVLDAILGIGGRPEVPEALRPLLRAVTASGTPVIAVDLPSFVDATTGQAAPQALRARSTVTFGAVKAGTLLPGGSGLVGRMHLVDIGLADSRLGAPAVTRLDDASAAELWPQPDREDSKYSRGVVALLAGSERYPGAAVLAASGAARAGAGMVRLVAPAEVIALVLCSRPEIVGHPIAAGGGPTADPSEGIGELGRTDALVVGPGLPADDPRARAGIIALSTAHRADGPDRGVIDAGALDALEAGDRFDAGVVLTPHRGEAARLVGRLGLDVDARPSAPAAPLAEAIAAASGATVLLKGAVTVIAPGHRSGGGSGERAGGSVDGGTGGLSGSGAGESTSALLAQDDAVAQLATAGTGDVLSGILGTLLATGLPGPEAAALAALLHGRAGRLASRGGVVPLVALDVAEHLPAAVGTILTCAQ